MNRKELDKRVENCMAELYQKSEGPGSYVCPQSFEMWGKYGIWVYDMEPEYERKPVTMPPFDLFYLSHEETESIVAKYTKGLHGFWYYTPKLTHGEPGYEEHVKELHDFRDFEAEVRKDKSLTYAQRAAKIKKEALAHNFIRRNRDAEYVSQSIYLGSSPTGSKKQAEKMWKLYGIVELLFDSGKVAVVYKDYVHATEFPYVLPSGTIVTVRKTMDGEYTKYTCYDDNNNAIDTLWNGVYVVRDMSAQSMELQIHDLKPQVLQKMREFDYDQAEIDEVAGDYMDRMLKQAVALYLMTKKYHADNQM